MKLTAKFIILILVLFTVLSIIALLTIPSKLENSLKVLVVTSTMLIYALIDYRLVIQNKNNLIERSKAFIWLNANVIFFTRVLFFILLFFAIFQLYVENQFNDFNGFAIEFAILYKDLNNGNLIPLIYGPFIHSGIAHWLGNGAMILIIGPIIWGISKLGFLKSFCLGNLVGIVSGYIAWKLGINDSVGYLGISAGIFSLWGFGIAFSLKNKTKVPSYMVITFTSLVISFTVFSSLISPFMTTIIHSFGLLPGLYFGYQERSGNSLI